MIVLRKLANFPLNIYENIRGMEFHGLMNWAVCKMLSITSVDEKGLVNEIFFYCSQYSEDLLFAETTQ